MNFSPARLSRRFFIQTSLTAAGGLVIEPVMPRLAAAAESEAAKLAPASPLGVYLRIEPNNRIVIGARSPEIGQGVKTSLPMILADELDADWSQVIVEQLPLGIDFGGATPAWRYGPQGAGGSTTIPNAWADLRQIGAQGRWLMRAAAAHEWGVPIEAIRTAAGHVVGTAGASGRRASYGSLAHAAATLTLPTAQAAE